jgi:hypothetical protein
MRLARGNRDRPAVVAAAMVAAAADTAVVAKVVVASEEATRNSLVPVAFLTTAEFARRGSAAVRTRDVLKRIEAGRTQHFDEKFGQGWIRTSEGVKPADLQSAPFGHFGTYPFCTTKAFGVDIARTLPLASSLASARRFS